MVWTQATTSRARVDDDSSALVDDNNKQQATTTATQQFPDPHYKSSHFSIQCTSRSVVALLLLIHRRNASIDYGASVNLRMVCDVVVRMFEHRHFDNPTMNAIIDILIFIFSEHNTRMEASVRWVRAQRQDQSMPQWMHDVRWCTQTNGWPTLVRHIGLQDYSNEQYYCFLIIILFKWIIVLFFRIMLTIITRSDDMYYMFQ